MSSSCEGFDIRLPAADAAATANASAAQSLKQQWKTATNMTKRWGKLLAAEELRLARRRRKILTLASALEFSASPAGLSWLNRAPLLYCSHDTHSRCLPARLLPPCTDKEPKPSYCRATRKADFLSPNKKGGGEKGELWLLFWSLHVPPRSCQTVSRVACRKRQDNNPYSLPSYTPPAPSQTHAHLCPPTTTTRALLLSRNEQKSIRRITRKFRPLLRRGHLERPDPTQCHRHSGDVISEGKNIMQHYLPLQVAQDGARLHLPPDILYIKKNTHTHNFTAAQNT